MKTNSTDSVALLRIEIFNWYSVYAKLNSHYEAWRYKRISKKRLKHTGNLFR